MRAAALAALALSIVGCGSQRHSDDVRRIEVAPSPEGPTLVASAGSAAGRRLLARIADPVPTTFPPNPAQECHLGTTVAITLGRRTYTYGPCTWPPSIARLPQTLIEAAQRPVTQARTTPVSAAAWKAVLRDWYDGHIDHRHPCQAVLAAIRHLHADRPTFSTPSA